MMAAWFSLIAYNGLIGLGCILWWTLMCDRSLLCAGTLRRRWGDTAAVVWDNTGDAGEALGLTLRNDIQEPLKIQFGRIH